MARNFILKIGRIVKIAQGNLYDLGLKETLYGALFLSALAAVWIYAAPFANHCQQDFLGAQTALNTVTLQEGRLDEGDYVGKCRLANKHLDLPQNLKSMRAACPVGGEMARGRMQYEENFYASLITLQDIAVHEACR